MANQSRSVCKGHVVLDRPRRSVNPVSGRGGGVYSRKPRGNRRHRVAAFERIPPATMFTMNWYTGVYSEVKPLRCQANGNTTPIRMNHPQRANFDSSWASFDRR